MRELRRMDKPVKRVMIARRRQHRPAPRAARSRTDYAVKRDRVQQGGAASCSRPRLGKALVLDGDVTDEELLEEENIDEMDLFVAVTNDDENNIMSSLLAKRMGARSVIALINRRSYVDLAAGRADRHRHLAGAGDDRHAARARAPRRRGRGAQPAARRRRGARGGRARRPRVAASVTGRRVGEIELPPGATIGAVVRGDAGDHGAPRHRHRAEDHVIVFVADKKILPQVEKLFQVGVRFL